MDYQKIDELLLKIKSAYESIGAETELVVEEPASIAEVESIENIIERKLPLQIRDFFLQYSKKCKFSAWLPDGFELPSELDEIFSANFLISLEEFADAEKARNGCKTDDKGVLSEIMDDMSESIDAQEGNLETTGQLSEAELQQKLSDEELQKKQQRYQSFDVRA